MDSNVSHFTRSPLQVMRVPQLLWCLLLVLNGASVWATTPAAQVAGDLPYQFSISRELSDEQQQQANRDYRHALQVLARGQKHKARELLQSSLSAYEHNVSALRLLAVLLIESEEYDQAEHLLKQAVEQYGLDLDLSKLLARVYFARGDYPAMLAWLQHSRQYLEPDKQWRALQAMALLKTEHFTQAVSAYASLRQDYPSQGQWWLGQASAHEALGQAPQAVAIYKQAVVAKVQGDSLRGYMQQKLQQLGAYGDE